MRPRWLAIAVNSYVLITLNDRVFVVAGVLSDFSAQPKLDSLTFRETHLQRPHITGRFLV